MDSKVKVATRQSFGEALLELGKKNKNVVVLDSDLSGATKTDLFAKEFPDRFFDMGIAESDMIGTAAGLAASGKIPFAATFAVFATGRCYDQIRASVAYPKLDVKICGTHAGITVGEDGATHQMLEDIGLMRGMPNMTVLTPSDKFSAMWAVEYAAKVKGPVYIRLARMATPVIYNEKTSFDKLSITHGSGKDATIFATGVEVAECLLAKEELEREGIDVRVVDMLSMKPIDEDVILKCSKETKCLISVEDHSIINGLGSAIADVLIEKNPVLLHKIGMKDTFGQSGKAEELLKHYGLDSKSIVKKVKGLVR
jgi:transketolase